MKFLKPGLQTSIQDSGRPGRMHFGVSHGGAMDPDSMKMANWLVGQPFSAPVLEVTLIGPEIEFDQNLSIAICGAQFEIFLNGKLQENDQTIQVKQKDILKFGKLIDGMRAYIAFSAELIVPQILSSYSTHLIAGFGGFKGRKINKGDNLQLSSNKRSGIKHSANKVIPSRFRSQYYGNYLLRCVPSLESNNFDQRVIQRFYSQNYQVSLDSNRMGIRLSCSESTLENDIQIISSGLTQGSIQIPPSGEPIISSVDGQTIGGYPRIANIVSADLALLGQLTPNDKIGFVLVGLDYATNLLKQKRLLLSFMDK